jgi:hypothetical protein
MPKPAVVDGAVLKCVAGSSPSNLTVTTDPFTQIECRLAATVLDNQPGINVKPFGACLILGGPCVPVIPAPWSPGATGILLASPFPLLPADSILMCAVGGIIQVISPGQSSVYVDTITTPGLMDFGADLKGLERVLDFLSTVSPFLKVFGLTMQIEEITAGFLMNDAQALRRRLRDPSLSVRQRAAIIKKARALQDLSEGGKALKLLRGLGAVGDVADAAALAIQIKNRDVRGATTSAVSLGATVVCGMVASATVVGVAGCALAGPAAAAAVNFAIDHRREIARGAVVVLTHTPMGAAAKFAVTHRDDIARAGERAAGTVRDVAVGAADKAKDVAVDVAGGVKGALKKIPKPPVPHFF